jgi:hypothetical protein
MNFLRFVSIGAACVLLSSPLTSCFFNINASALVGSGNVITQQRTVGAFTAVSTSFSGDVDVICKSSTLGAVEISADDNIVPYIKTDIVGSTLRIYTDGFSGFTSSRRIYVRIPAQMIERFEQSGSGNSTITALDAPTFVLTLSGSGDVQANGTMQAVTTTISGSGSVRFVGNGQTMTATISGSGNLDARQFTAQQVTARVSGSGNASVYASQMLDGTVSGSGTIFYYGNPPTVRRAVSGSGAIVAGR